MNKRLTFKHFIIKWQSIMAILVIVGYSLIMNWYFVRGLDQSNLMSLNLEMQAFAKAYQNNLKPDIPRSIHFNGYMGWNQVPQWVKSEFPELKNISQLQMRDVKLFKEDNTTLSVPSTVAFVVAQPLFDGQLFYLTREINIDLDQNPQAQEQVFSMFRLTWPLALGFLILIMSAVYLIIKRLTKPMADLANWADSLTLNDIGNQAPSFGFEELNRIAKRQQATFTRIANVLDKEQEFLRNASHELRTPIAVVKSNSELLARVLKDNKAQASVERITRAALNMQQMTETLLWLSRDEEQSLEKTEVNLSTLLHSLVKENEYLLQEKSVSVQLNVPEHILFIPQTPCRIALSNLIRNAFQYTLQGKVEISLYHYRVIIKNTNDNPLDSVTASEDYGYGLGLNLVEKIVGKLRWQYENVEFNGGRNVTIEFK